MPQPLDVLRTAKGDLIALLSEEAQAVRDYLASAGINTSLEGAGTGIDQLILTGEYDMTRAHELLEQWEATGRKEWKRAQRRQVRGEPVPRSLLTRFGVKNYKCLVDVNLPLTPIHVLIGQNDAGKTSLLEAMLAFFRSSQMDLARAYPGKWQGNDLVFEGAAEPVIELDGAFGKVDEGGHTTDELSYGFQVEFSKGTQVLLRGEWFGNGHDDQRHDLPKYAQSVTSVFYRSNIPPSDQRLPLFQIASYFGPAHLYRFDPRLMAMPATIDPNRKFRMDPDGFGLASLLDDLLGFRPELFIDIRNRFCEYFPQFRSVRLEVEPAAQRQYNEAGISSMGGSPGKGIYFETRRGRAIRAQQASDGAILFLGFLAITHLPEPPKLLLIEEPEKGVYPKRLDEMVGLLKEAVASAPHGSQPQVVLSTHSPYLLSFFTPDQVTLMSRQPDGSVRVRPLRDAPNIEERMAGEFYLGELWYNLSEEELFGDGQSPGA